MLKTMADAGWQPEGLAHTPMHSANWLLHTLLSCYRCAAGQEADER